MKPFSTLPDLPAPVIGTWSQFASPEVIDILGGSGFALTIVDTEHGHFGLETAENPARACDAAGPVPIVRIPGHEGTPITKAPDIGAAAMPEAADCRRRMHEWRRLGVRLFTVGTDKLLFADYRLRYNQELRADAND